MHRAAGVLACRVLILFSYFLKRIVQSVGVMLCVALLSFSLFNFVGDPINNMVGEETSTEERAELRETLGLNDPIHIQFGRFCGKCRAVQFWKILSVAAPGFGIDR